MTFQQRVAVLLTLTVTDGSRTEAFVLISLNWLVLALWSLLTLPGRTWSRLALVVARGQAAVDRWLTAFPFGRRVIWAIG